MIVLSTFVTKSFPADFCSFIFYNFPRFQYSLAPKSIHFTKEHHKKAFFFVVAKQGYKSTYKSRLIAVQSSTTGCIRIEIDDPLLDLFLEPKFPLLRWYQAQFWRLRKNLPCAFLNFLLPPKIDSLKCHGKLIEIWFMYATEFIIISFQLFAFPFLSAVPTPDVTLSTKKTNYALKAPFIHIRWLAMGIAKHAVISKLLDVFFSGIDRVPLINAICNYMENAWWFIVCFNKTDTRTELPASIVTVKSFGNGNKFKRFWGWLI